MFKYIIITIISLMTIYCSGIKTKKYLEKETTTELDELIKYYYEFVPFNLKIKKGKYPFGDDPKHQDDEQKQYFIENHGWIDQDDKEVHDLKDIIVLRFEYNNTLENYKYEKVYIFNLEKKKYQYVSFRIPIIVDHDNYRGLEENFGYLIWNNIHCSESKDKSDQFICDLYNILKDN